MSRASHLVSWGVRTDVGRVRNVNQDSVHATDVLFVVADGMGGHSGGEVASAVAIEAMQGDLEQPGSLESLISRVRRANAAIIDHAAHDDSLAGMGTTLCALAVLEPDWRGGTRLGLVNVGDSRIYRFANGELEQVSHDHSLVAELVRDGHLTDDEAAVHPQRNIVTRALGISDDVDIDSWEIVGRRGERYLLCSDGLVNEVSDAQIAAALRRLEDPAEVVDELVRLANESGARDNVSVVVVRIDAGEPGPADALPDSARTRAASPGSTSAYVSPPSIAGSEADAADYDDYDDDDTYDEVRWDDDDDSRRVRRRGRIRAAISLLVVGFILAAAITLIGLYARNNYFVTFDGDQVVVFQGRPDGVLWFDPTVERPTQFLRADLAPALVVELDAIPEFGTLAEANDYVADLQTRVTGFSS